jgi:hypothetical protein
VTDDLTEQIAEVIAGVDLVEGADERRGNLPEGYDGPTARADAVCREVLGPLLAERETLRDGYARMMQENQTMHALVVSLRDDIIRLVTAATGSWDSAANADEQITKAVWVIAENRELTAACSCPHTYADYNGPEPDCPVHGAVRAFNEASVELERLRREVGFEAKALDTHGEWFGMDKPERVCACITEEQATKLDPGFSRPMCAVHHDEADPTVEAVGNERPAAQEAGEPSAQGPRTLTVTWHPNAIRTAVDHAMTILHDDTEAEVFHVAGGFLTTMDLMCLIDAGRAFLGQEGGTDA